MWCWFDRQGIKGCGVGLTDKGLRGVVLVDRQGIKGCGVGLTDKGLRGVVLV